MKRRNKYRFNARARTHLWWVEYWNTYSWCLRWDNEAEREPNCNKACRAAKDNANFMVSGYRKRCF